MLVRRFQSRRDTRKSSRRGRTSEVQNARDIPKQFEKSWLIFRSNHRKGNLPSFEDLMQLLFLPTSLPWTSNYQNSELHLYVIHSSPKSLPTLQCPRGARTGHGGSSPAQQNNASSCYTPNRKGHRRYQSSPAAPYKKNLTIFVSLDGRPGLTMSSDYVPRHRRS